MVVKLEGGGWSGAAQACLVASAVLFHLLLPGSDNNGFEKVAAVTSDAGSKT